MKLKLFFLLFALFVFNAYVGVAQTSVKSGNIRDCEVWACNSNTFKDATVFVGPHNIVASPNSVNTNSISFTLNLDGSRQSSSITFNGSDGINFSGTTDMSVCNKTYINNETVINIAANASVLTTGNSGTSALTTGKTPITGEVTIGFYCEMTDSAFLKANCNNGRTADYKSNTIYEVRLRNTLLFTLEANDIMYNFTDGLPHPLPGGNGTYTITNILTSHGRRSYYREWKQNVTAGDYIWVGVKAVRKDSDDPCRTAYGASVASYNNDARPTKAIVKMTDCRGTF